jgi:hypothetical protein
MRVQDQKGSKSSLKLHGTSLQGKSIGSNPKKGAKKERAHDFKDQDAAS